MHPSLLLVPLLLPVSLRLSHPHGEGRSAPPEARRYTKIMTYQVNWITISEHPMTPDYVLLYAKTYNYRNHGVDSIASAPAVQRVWRAFRRYRDAPRLQVEDIRLVALFYAPGRVDTLVVDKEGDARFLGKTFHLTTALGALLKVRYAAVNADYRGPVFNDEAWK
jgi:hypothetical protein